VNNYAMAVEDISFNIILDERGIPTRSAMKCNESSIDKNMIKINQIVVRGNGSKAIKLIEDFLEKEEMVIIRTIDSYLPFSIHYNPNIDPNKFSEIGHVFMIVGQDEYNFYYVDQISELDKKNYKSANERQDIGVYSKKDFMKSLSFYTRVMT
jgi:uncharacterized protein YvpB